MPLKVDKVLRHTLINLNSKVDNVEQEQLKIITTFRSEVSPTFNLYLAG